jgi:hypothetical protein
VLGGRNIVDRRIAHEHTVVGHDVVAGQRLDRAVEPGEVGLRDAEFKREKDQLRVKDGFVRANRAALSSRSNSDNSIGV